MVPGIAIGDGNEFDHVARLSPQNGATPGFDVTVVRVGAQGQYSWFSIIHHGIRKLALSILEATGQCHENSLP